MQVARISLWIEQLQTTIVNVFPVVDRPDSAFFVLPRKRYIPETPNQLK